MRPKSGGRLPGGTSSMDISCQPALGSTIFALRASWLSCRTRSALRRICFGPGPYEQPPADHGTILTALLTEGVAVAVEGVDFVGLRSEQFSEMARLFRDVIGVPLTSPDHSRWAVA